MNNCPSQHPCFCGTASQVPHPTGHCGCKRKLVEAPQLVRKGRHPWEDFWLVGGQEISGYTLLLQRFYKRHDCGCWSSSGDSTNSIDA